MNPDNKLPARDKSSREDSKTDSHDESTRDSASATATDDPTDSSKKSDSKASKTKGDALTSTATAEESTITDSLITRTDSGRTVTLRNSKIVTVIRHTKVITGRPPPPTSSVPEPTIISSRPIQDGPEQTSLPPPAETATTKDSSGSHSGGPLPTGAIIGIGIGGAAIVAFLVIMAIMVKRRFQRRHEDGGAAADSSERDHRFDEKHSPDLPQHITPHTTGTQTSQDPFAPFGGLYLRPLRPSNSCIVCRANRHLGRADKEYDYPYHPENNTFEMDAADAAPVELPDTSPEMIPPPAMSGAQLVSPVADSGPTDPRANLNSLGSEDGTPKYVNHWNQYRGMSSG